MILKRKLILMMKEKGLALLYPYAKHVFNTYHFTQSHFSSQKRINKLTRQKHAKQPSISKDNLDNQDIVSLCDAIINKSNKAITSKIQYLKVLYPKLKDFHPRNEPDLVSCLEEMITNVNQSNIQELSLEDSVVISEIYLLLIERKVFRPQRYYEHNLHQNFINKLSAEMNRMPLQKLVQYYGIYAKFTLSRSTLHSFVSNCILDRIESRGESNSINFMLLENLLVGFERRYSLSHKEIFFLKRVYEMLLQRYDTLVSHQKVRVIGLVLQLGNIYNSIKIKIQSQLFKRFAQDLYKDKINLREDNAYILLNITSYHSEGFKEISTIIVEKIIHQTEQKQQYSEEQCKYLMDAVLSYSCKNKFSNLNEIIQNKFLKIMHVFLGSSNRVSMQNKFASIVDYQFFQNDRQMLQQLIHHFKDQPLSPKLLYICSKRLIPLTSNQFTFYEHLVDKINSQPAQKDDYSALSFALIAANYQLNIPHQSSSTQKILNSFNKFHKYFENVAKSSNCKTFLFYLENCEPIILNQLSKSLKFASILSLVVNQLEEPTFSEQVAYKYLTLKVQSKQFILPQNKSNLKGNLFYFLLIKQIQTKELQWSISANLLNTSRYYLNIVLASTKADVKVGHVNLTFAFAILDYLERLTCLFLQNIDTHCHQLYFYQYWNCLLSLAKYCSSVQNHPSLYYKFCNMIYLMLNNNQFEQIQQFNTFLATILKHVKGIYPNDLAVRLTVANLYRKNNIDRKDYQTYLPLLLEKENSILNETREITQYFLSSEKDKQLLEPKTIVASMMNSSCLKVKNILIKSINSPYILAKALSFFDAPLNSKNYQQRLSIFQHIVCSFITQFDQQLLQNINLIQIVSNLTKYCSLLAENTSKQLLKWLQFVQSHHFKHFNQYPIEYHIDLLKNICQMVIISQPYLEKIFDKVIFLQSDINTPELRFRAMALLIKTDFAFTPSHTESIIENVLLKYKSQAMFIYLQLEPLFSKDQKNKTLNCLFKQYNKMDGLYYLINCQLVHAYLMATYSRQYQNSFVSRAVQFINKQTQYHPFVQHLTDKIKTIANNLNAKSSQPNQICNVEGIQCFKYKQLVIFQSSLDYCPSNYSLSLLSKLLAVRAKVNPQQIVIIAKQHIFLNQSKSKTDMRLYSSATSTSLLQIKQEMGILP